MQVLKNKAEFDLVYKNGLRHYGRFFNLYALSLAQSFLQSRTFSYKERKVLTHLLGLKHGVFLGMSVSRKIGNAPQRNKIKRRFKAFMRGHQGNLVTTVLVIVAKEGASCASYWQMAEEIECFLQTKWKKYVRQACN